MGCTTAARFDAAVVPDLVSGADWASLRGAVRPGAHVAVLRASARSMLEARRRGFKIRDTLVLFEGGSASLAVLLRSPCDDSVPVRVLAAGVGALNIDACRTPGDVGRPGGLIRVNRRFDAKPEAGGRQYRQPPAPSPLGRWPTNVLLVHSPGCGIECVPGCAVPVVSGVLQTSGLFPALFPREELPASWLEKLICPPGAPILLSRS